VKLFLYRLANFYKGYLNKKGEFRGGKNGKIMVGKYTNGETRFGNY
jgi:hypothetical protein